MLITVKLRSYAAAIKELCIHVEHGQHKGLNNRAENSHQSTGAREKVMRRFKSARQLQRFASIHDQVANLFRHCRHNPNAQAKRNVRNVKAVASGKPFSIPCPNGKAPRDERRGQEERVPRGALAP